MTYLTGRCPLCKRATIHVTAAGKRAMEQRGCCEMCRRDQFMVPLYYLECMEQSLLNVAVWDASNPGPVPIAVRAHQLPQDERSALRTIYKKREEQTRKLRAALVRAGALQETEVLV